MSYEGQGMGGSPPQGPVEGVGQRGRRQQTRVRLPARRLPAFLASRRQTSNPVRNGIPPGSPTSHMPPAEAPYPVSTAGFPQDHENRGPTTPRVISPVDSRPDAVQQGAGTDSVRPDLGSEVSQANYLSMLDDVNRTIEHHRPAEVWTSSERPDLGPEVSQAGYLSVTNQVSWWRVSMASRT